MSFLIQRLHNNIENLTTKMSKGKTNSEPVEPLLLVMVSILSVSLLNRIGCLNKV